MKKIVSIWLALCMLIALSLGVIAEETGQASQIEFAPLNPLYEEYLKMDEAERKGLVQPPMFEVAPQQENETAPYAVFPPTYDLREEGAVPAVKNQYNTGSCWAFAGLASLESYLKREYQQNYDFSAKHLEYSQVYQMKDGINKEAFNRVANSGGSPEMVEAYLYRGAGPISESAMPFTDSVENMYLSEVDLPVSDIRLMDFQYLPYNKSGQSQESIIANIKSAVVNRGMVDVNINFSHADYRSDTYSLFVKNSTAINHAVGIVGWDDQFSRSNFSQDPGMDGAWIVQNSWGNSWGKNGYFYLSYAQNIVMPVVVERAQQGRDYDNVYYHDPLGFSQFIGYVEYPGLAYAANVFETAPGAQELTEVTVGTAGYTSYQIYVNPRSSSLAQSDLQLVKTGTIGYTGYQTIQLDTPLTLTGKQFAVVVRYNTPGTNYGVPVECRSSNSYYAKVEAEPGESYVSPDMNYWQEISNSENKYSNCCIKAYTKNISERAEVTFQKSPAHTRITLKKGNQTIKAQPGGTYLLEPGSYTYDAEAMDYNMLADRSFTVSASETGRTKKVTVTLSQGAAPPQVLQHQQEIIYHLRTPQTADYPVELGTKGAAATGILKVMDEDQHDLVRGRDYRFQDDTLSLLSTYTDSITLTDEDYAVLEGPSRTLQLVFNDAAQTTVPIVLKFKFAGIRICMAYIEQDLENFVATNQTTNQDIMEAARAAYVNPLLQVKYDMPLAVTPASGIQAGKISGTLYLLDDSTSTRLTTKVDIPIYPYTCQVRATNTSGQEVNQLQYVQQLNVKVSGSINVTPEKNNRIYIGIYDQNGKLKRVKQIPQSLVTMNGNQYTAEVAVQVEPKSMVQVMVWDGAGMHPLSAPALWQLQ